MDTDIKLEYKWYNAVTERREYNKILLSDFINKGVSGDSDLKNVDLMRRRQVVSSVAYLGGRWRKDADLDRVLG